MAEVKTKYDHMSSFGFSFCLYLIVSVVARVVPILVRTLLSLFVHTPSVNELKADGSYLFDVIYPLFGFLMLAGYFAAMYYCFRFAASKVAYRTLKQTSNFRIVTELALVLFVGLAFDIYLMFGMELRSEFWYAAGAYCLVHRYSGQNGPAGHRFRTRPAVELFYTRGPYTAYSRHRRRSDACAHCCRVFSGLLRTAAWERQWALAHIKAIRRRFVKAWGSNPRKKKTGLDKPVLFC